MLDADKDLDNQFHRQLQTCAIYWRFFLFHFKYTGTNIDYSTTKTELIMQ